MSDWSFFLPLISKVFEKLSSKEITIFMDLLLLKYQFGFGKIFCAQHCLLVMLEKWESVADKGKVFIALLTYLSKAFDCLSHELINTKTYGISPKAQKLMHNYL